MPFKNHIIAQITRTALQQPGLGRARSYHCTSGPRLCSISITHVFEYNHPLSPDERATIERNPLLNAAGGHAREVDGLLLRPVRQQ